MKTVALALVLACLSAPASADVDEKAGDEFRITVAHQSASEGDDGSSSSTSGRHEYLERILNVRPDGVERLYDLPLEPGDEKRLINWQFPVRVFEASDGSIHILNREELEKRRDTWLTAAEIPKEACGTWYFTWNAFQVECDPDAMIETIRALKIQPESLAEGELLDHPASIKPGRLTKLGEEGLGSTYMAEMPVDPDYFHRAAANSAVAVGQIMKEPVTFEQAYEKQKATQIAGTIEVTLVSRADGRVWKQTTSIETIKTDAGGEVERTVSTETVKREGLEPSKS